LTHLLEIKNSQHLDLRNISVRFLYLDEEKRAVVRIPWNHLVRSFSKDRPLVASDLYKLKSLYQTTTEGKLE